MARVSLIVPTAEGSPPPTRLVRSAERALVEAGHEVEVIVAGMAAPEGDEGSAWNAIEAEPGLARAAVAGLRAADGEVLLVLDPRMGYAGEDAARVVETLARGDADLALGCRSLPWVGRLARLLLGSADPMSGLLGLTREHRDEWVGELEPVGSKVAWVLLAKTQGRRVDVPIGPASMRGPERGRLQLDDLRQLKKLADDRFGNFSRLVQFCVVGASGMVVDLSCYALFQFLLHRTPLREMRAPLLGGPLDLAVAAALAIGVAVTWNFSLNRRLTFSYARHGSTIRQFATYLLSNALGVALSFSLRLVLPARVPFFARHKLAAAVVGIVAATGISFSMSRYLVFRNRTVLGQDVDLAAEAAMPEAAASN